jgi:UrcA family protein
MKLSVLLTCVGVLGLSCGAASAQNFERSREPAELRMSIEDVNFANANSVKRFQERLWRAAVQVCDSDGQGLIRYDDQRCAKATYDRAVNEAARVAQAQNQDTSLLLAAAH